MFNSKNLTVSGNELLTTNCCYQVLNSLQSLISVNNFYMNNMNLSFYFLFRENQFMLHNQKL